jgi:hypothetical protein
LVLKVKGEFNVYKPPSNEEGHPLSN